MNLSVLDDNSTAKTNIESAYQRSDNLCILGSKKVLELCVGPSLKVLEKAYKSNNIECWGNDFEQRWKDYYPKGKWIMGNCFDIDFSTFDTIVFAPPLSIGCTGRRIDSLSINQITPSYQGFMQKASQYPNILKVMVLPAKVIITNFDKKQLYKLLSKIKNYDMDILTEGKRKIRKYVDIYYK